MSTNQRPLILIVDDDRTISTSLAGILEQEGYEVDTAGDGAEAVRKSNERVFDLALVDMRLPDMLGVELLGKLKQRTPRTAKIIVTGYPSMQNAIGSVNEGADGYILKPVDGEKLLSSVKKHLAQRKESVNYSMMKVTEFLQTRAKELGKPSASSSGGAKTTTQ